MAPPPPPAQEPPKEMDIEVGQLSSYSLKHRIGSLRQTRKTVMQMPFTEHRKTQIMEQLAAEERHL
eukprot:8870261-Prorocentrum_lima.AAC.1